MKKQGHPPYQETYFLDSATGIGFICGSTIKTKDTIEVDGKIYPLYVLSISSASHPFFTKKNQFLDTEGRVDKFNKRYEKKKQIIPPKPEPIKKGAAKKDLEKKKK